MLQRCQKCWAGLQHAAYSDSASAARSAGLQCSALADASLIVQGTSAGGISGPRAVSVRKSAVSWLALGKRESQALPLVHSGDSCENASSASLGAHGWLQGDNMVSKKIRGTHGCKALLLFVGQMNAM